MKILVVAARIVGHRCLEALLESGADVGALLYLSDEKSSVTVAHSGFDDLIETYRLNAMPFVTLKGEAGKAAREFSIAARPDLGIVVGVSELIPDEMLKLPPRGFIGMHPALLPQGRGRAPIPWALIHDLPQTGVTLFYADGNADTGDILDQEAVTIRDSDTAAVLGARTDEAACRLLVKNIPLLANGTAQRRKQDETQATVWPRRRPEDGLIDWRKTARALYNWVRALTLPYPGAFTVLNGRKLFVWAAEMSGEIEYAPAGEIVALDETGAARIATGRGTLKLTNVQWEDGPQGTPAAIGLKSGMHLGEKPS
jgi:methionyl-tRNA formyltransferase